MAASPPSSLRHRLQRLILVVIVVAIAAGVRLYAIPRLDVDYDEPVYLAAAVEYARAMRQGDFKMLAWIEHTYEHPALVKIMYGAFLLTQTPLERMPESDLPRLAPIASTEAGPWDIAARYFSAFWGVLGVLVLALINPLAGLFLAVSTVVVKHTSEVYLESVPMLTGLLCAVTYLKGFEVLRIRSLTSRSAVGWLALSAAFLGMTVAGKYAYGIVGAGVLLHFLAAVLRRELPPRALGILAAYGLLSIIMFFVFDPYLWPHPIARLLKSLQFNVEFQDSRLVHMYDYPWWQPFRWIAAFSVYFPLHPDSAFLINIDTFIFVAAMLGLPRLFRLQPFYFYWFLAGMAFLLIWKTKWPHYTLILMAPFSLAAAHGVLTVWDLARRALNRDSTSPT